jgi:uncharacterized protein (TIGR03067 family)
MSATASNGKGTWRQVAVVIDGKNVPVGPGAILTVDVDKGGYTVTVPGLFGPRVYQKGTARSDYDKTPPQSDVTVTEGPQAGTTIRQIFKYEGDVMIACNAPPGAERPAEFTSQPGSGHTLSVWLRTSASPPPGPLTRRTWFVIGVLILLGIVVGSVGQDLEASLGRWAGILGGWLAGVFIYTAIFLVIKQPWQLALTYGMVIAVAGVTFDVLRTTLTPTLGPLGAILVSASTAIVAATFVWMACARLTKAHLWIAPNAGSQKPTERG